MHHNPLKRVKPVRSSAAATPEANLPQGLARNNDRDCSMGNHGEQATTCEVAAGCSGGGALQAARSGQSEVPRAPGPKPCSVSLAELMHSGIGCASPPRPSICHSPLTSTAYTRARAPM
jgi:hypothetical protein